MIPIKKFLRTKTVIQSTIFKIFSIFRSQRLTTPMLIVYLILIVSILFAFLAYAPVLSPFIYPLF